MAAAATNSLLGFARLSVLSGAGNTNGTLPLPTSFGDGTIGYIQELLASWFKLDITTLAVMLTIFGTVSGALKDLHVVALKVYWWFTKLFTASISIASNDRLNREILNWVGANILTRQKTRILTARTELVQSDAYSWSRKTERNELHERRVPIQFLPTFGTTWFIFNRNIFLVRRISPQSHYSSNTIPDEYAAAPEGDEPLVVMCLGRSVKPIKDFLEAARDFAEKQREEFITIRASKNEYHSDSWDTTIMRPIRPLETVHFDETVKEELVADIRNYLDPITRKFYTSRGIPYRRGFLLYGTPGTGKTSLSLALAGLFGLELYLVHLPSVREDSELTKMFTSLPTRCIVLLEDIDAVGVKRQPAGPPKEEGEESDEEDDDPIERAKGTRCTLSGLLNVLDGVASQEGRIVIMTSNHAEKLDKALIRPGRIDRKIYLGPISQRSAELMFLRMYASDPSVKSPVKFGFEDGELEKLALKFSMRLTDQVFTPAQLQGYLLNHRDFPARAVDEIEEWVVEETMKMEEEKAREKKLRAWRKEKKRKALADLLAKSSGGGRDMSDIESGGEKGVIRRRKRAKKEGAVDEKEDQAIDEKKEQAVENGVKGEPAIELKSESTLVENGTKEDEPAELEKGVNGHGDKKEKDTTKEVEAVTEETKISQTEKVGDVISGNEKTKEVLEDVINKTKTNGSESTETETETQGEDLERTGHENPVGMITEKYVAKILLIIYFAWRWICSVIDKHDFAMSSLRWKNEAKRRNS